MKTKAGDRFTVAVADGVVLMEARNIRCGDVWDCYPVDPDDDYGTHMVFTDEQVAFKVGLHTAWKGTG